MTVLGYQYDSGLYCDDCTKQYIIYRVKELHSKFKLHDDLHEMFEIDDYCYYDYKFEDYLETMFQWSDIDDYIELIEDYDHNRIHVLLDNVEVIDNSEYCDNLQNHQFGENKEALQLREANIFTDSYLGEYYEELDCLSYDIMKQQIIFKANYEWNLRFNDENETNRQNALIEYIDDQCRKILKVDRYDNLQWTFYQQEHNHDECYEDHNLVIVIKKI
jgi:hypothetical protein